MKRKLIASIVFIILVIAGCIGYYIHKQVVPKQQLEIENNSRNEYIRQAREQDSLRIAHYQDSVEKARLATIAQKEKEEAERIKAEQERKKQEEAKKDEERRVAEEKAKKEAVAKRIAEDKLKANGSIQGHEYVDLGLSTLWAICNIGASRPDEYGKYFAWGETTSKWDFHSSTYKFDDSPNIGNDISGTQYDAAKVNWGDSWEMPSKEDWLELINLCKWTESTLNGHKGWLIEGPNGKTIFLPAAGWYIGDDVRKGEGVCGNCNYWSSTLHYKYSFNANHLWGKKMEDSDCGYGMPIRPVISTKGRRLIKIEKELKEYDKLIKDSVKNSTPKFGLG